MKKAKQDIFPEEEIPRQFIGVFISRTIWLATDIKWPDKCLLAEIESLSDPELGCWASNGYLAYFFGTTAGRIANQITRLRRLEYLKTESFNGRKRYIKVISRVHQSVKADFTNQLMQHSPIGEDAMVCKVTQVSHNNCVTDVKNDRIVIVETAIDDSKYKKLKRREKIEEELFDPMFNPADPNHLPQQLRTPEVIEIWGKYCNRRETLLKNPVTAFALKKILNQLSTATAEEAADALFRAWDGKWTGIFPKKNGQQSFKKPQKVEPFAEGKVF